MYTAERLVLTGTSLVCHVIRRINYYYYYYYHHHHYHHHHHHHHHHENVTVHAGNMHHPVPTR